MRHHARVDPFGDVDVVIGQECLDRAAQQCRIVARHRRHDQQFRLRTTRRSRKGALKMQQPAERTMPNALDGDRNLLGADGGRVDSPVRTVIAARRAFEQFHRRRHGLAIGGVRERVGGIFEEQPCSIGKGARWIERGVSQFVEPVHGGRQQRPAVAGERRCSAEFTYRHRISPRPSLQCGRLSFFCHSVNIAKSCSCPVYNAAAPISPNND